MANLGDKLKPYEGQHTKTELIEILKQQGTFMPKYRLILGRACGFRCKEGTVFLDKMPNGMYEVYREDYRF